MLYKIYKEVCILKKEKKVFLACIALLLMTILTVYVVSGTYAKNATGTDRAAKWAWNINDQNLAAGTTQI